MKILGKQNKSHFSVMMDKCLVFRVQKFIRHLVIKMIKFMFSKRQPIFRSGILEYIYFFKFWDRVVNKLWGNF